MAGKAKTRGEPPKKLTGKMPVRPADSPWWDRVMSEITGPGGMVGRTLSIEELAEALPRYPSGGRVRPRAAAKRLRPILELVSRGPNGSLGRGAVYTIKPQGEPSPQSQLIRTDTPDEEVPVDANWLELSIKRMTGE